MLNIEIIFEAIKHYNYDNKYVFNIIQHILGNTYNCHKIMQLQQINYGEAKTIYISKDNTQVYKIERNQANLYRFIEEIYLLNNQLKDNFALDCVSIEKIENEYVYCFIQPYYKPFICNTKLDCIKLKTYINTYMKIIGYQLNKKKSNTNDNFNLTYFNDKYQIFDLTNKNVTLINNEKIFIYDAEIIKR